MTGRPENLFPLFGDLEGLDGIGPKTARLFKGLSVETPRDLLFVLPHSGIDRRLRNSVRDVEPPEVATVEVEIGNHLPPRQRGRPYRIIVQDALQEFQLVYFHGKGDYLQNLLPTGQRRILSGRVETFDGVYQMSHPDHVLRLDEADALPDWEPVYPLTAGVTQRLMSKAMASALARVPALSEWIDPALKARMGWQDWRNALQAAHAPGSGADLAPSAAPRQRLAYDELFAHQLTLAIARATRRRADGAVTQGDGHLVNRVMASLPYEPTSAQRRAIAEITADMATPQRMNRLLQGDVGAGKTLVAMAALLTAVEAGGQGALMAPTEILARQHVEALAPLAAAAGVRVDLLTGRDKGRERARKLGALAGGQIDVLIGTHALFQRDVTFHDLRLAVIDEQHRFGVAQRMALGEKGAAVDILVMTATPIPRSLALAQYGDMDLSLLDEKPPGRLPIVTSLASTERLAEVVGHLRRAVSEGKQAYWVCPLVEESESVNLTAAQARFEQLRAQLGETVGLIHGQLPPAEKDAAMARFVAGESRVLVAATVIEVGVNVPAATIMVIERAESFGLAQLHQLRGRVGRGSGASTCLLLYDPPLGETAARRLKLMRDTEDGFKISDEDLAIRGAGDVIGTAQSGLPRFRMADLERQAPLMQIAQTDARKLLHDDPTLQSPRGKAARVLLWLMEQEKAIRLMQVG
ncbi:ATP-dependent DNA helicase RecG [Pararhodobacter zhoushanensis]|uniref:Probable DNA 3'-5' helicase RecG n=1 Tax=Pararhodobacter zhoushanensis TaxID=2479545 RepID=A0ABT3GYZ6_9RHOB|nr:ATP-dependent DNA helicase RecG [Pararhodobacter zhoushanensis]MCW1932786.1 ATP-dependent DNA helicase RecG [Pararhodobacter zhoushanensis]